MASSTPSITSHPGFRVLSNEFYKPYPPYVLVDSGADTKPVLGAGCEAGYLLVLDADAPEGTKKLSSSNINEYRDRVGILILSQLPPDPSQSLRLIATGGTMIGFASPLASKRWKEACIEWAKQEKVLDAAGKEQDGVVLEWDASESDGWVAWSVTKKAPDWAFC
ncbi:hypothetical protein FS749_004266 [Ceratobasidium sp. UAMH 11750]|nr:hypothetical protein FS749_004266 [Ceratobasidium sp. UAMH 11750]